MYVWSNLGWKCGIYKIYRILMSLPETNMAAWYVNIYYSVEYNNIWSSRMPKPTVQILFKVLRIRENPQTVD